MNSEVSSNANPSHIFREGPEEMGRIMFVLMPHGLLANLNFVQWLEVTSAPSAPELFVVCGDSGPLTEPITCEEAEAILAQIAQLVNAQHVGAHKGNDG